MPGLQELLEVPCCYTFRFHAQRLEKVQQRRGSVPASLPSANGKQADEQAVLFLQVPTEHEHISVCCSSTNMIFDFGQSGIMSVIVGEENRIIMERVVLDDAPKVLRKRIQTFWFIIKIGSFECSSGMVTISFVQCPFAIVFTTHFKSTGAQGQKGG